MSGSSFAIRSSMASLIAANMVPLLGVWAMGWSAASVIFLFVAETAVVGVFTWLRMAFSRGGLLERLFSVGFFTVHYGVFMLGQGLFAVMFFMPGDGLSDSEVQDISLGVGAFALSHGWSFLVHFLWGPEREHADAMQEMGRPYGRIVIQHVAVLGAGWSLGIDDMAMAGATIIVLGKTGLDLGTHLWFHGKHSRLNDGATGQA